MTDPLLNLSIFIIWWWMALFVVLPIGVKRIADADAAQGHDAGAPQAPNLAKKALWAAGIALILWAITFAIIAFDPFNIRD